MSVLMNLGSEKWSGQIQLFPVKVEFPQNLNFAQKEHMQKVSTAIFTAFFFSTSTNLNINVYLIH